MIGIKRKIIKVFFNDKELYRTSDHPYLNFVMHKIIFQLDEDYATFKICEKIANTSVWVECDDVWHEVMK